MWTKNKKDIKQTETEKVEETKEQKVENEVKEILTDELKEIDWQIEFHQKKLKKYHILKHITEEKLKIYE